LAKVRSVVWIPGVATPLSLSKAQHESSNLTGSVVPRAVTNNH
jgi:hypothetical protein